MSSENATWLGEQCPFDIACHGCRSRDVRLEVHVRREPIMENGVITWPRPRVDCYMLCRDCDADYEICFDESGRGRITPG